MSGYYFNDNIFIIAIIILIIYKYDANEDYDVEEMRFDICFTILIWKKLFFGIILFNSFGIIILYKITLVNNLPKKSLPLIF